MHVVCDLVLESNRDFPELVQVVGRQSNLRVHFVDERYDGPQPEAWYHQWLLPDGEVWLTLGKSGRGYLLRFPELADFVLSPDLRLITCHYSRSAGMSTIRHLFLDQVIPLLLSAQGKFVLHASAVVINGGAYAFAGASGSGKSTLAASLVGAGFPLLTDDCCVLDVAGNDLLVTPSYPDLRLHAPILEDVVRVKEELPLVAEYTYKRRLSLQGRDLPFCERPVSLRRIYLIGKSTAPGSDVRITPTPASEAFMELVRLKYRLDIGNRQGLAAELPGLQRLATSFVYWLKYPWDVTMVSRVRDQVLGHCGLAAAQ